MTVRAINNLADVPWQIWEELAEKTGQLFLARPYVEAWVKHILPEEHPSASLSIFQISEGEQIVGFLPFFQAPDHSTRIFKLLGTTEVTDYVDVLALPGHYPLVAEALVQLLDDPVHDTQLDLQCLLPSAALLEIAKLLPPEIQTEQVTQTVNPCITLPASWDEYLSLVPHTHLKHYRHLLTKIGEEDDISYRCLTTATEISPEIETFITLHKQSGSEKAAFWTPGREAFFHEMSEEIAKLGKVKLYFLDVNNDPAAALLVFDHWNEFQLYNSGFNAYRYGYLGVGNALILHTIQEAIAQGKKGYNFLRGDEAYKFTFGAVASPVYALNITRK